MPVSERDRSRLQALILLVRPARSIAAHMQRLSDEQRDWYQGWAAHWAQWMQRHDDEDGRAYGATLQGFGPIQCRPDIHAALFGATPQILKTDDDDTAARKYTDHCNDEISR